MSAVDTKAQRERAEKVRKWAERIGVLSMAVPSPLGDVMGIASDMAVPENRTPLGIGLGLAGLLPGIPNASVTRPSLRKLDKLFDAEKGIGAVPDNQDLEKLGGAVKYMRPSEYLHMAEPLTRPSERSLEYIRKSIAEGKTLGQPRLSVDLVKDVPTVVNHDGRHRAMVIKELFGDDVLMPVHVKGIGPYRALPKHLEMDQFAPQRETDATLAEAMKKADILLQRHKDKLR